MDIHRRLPPLTSATTGFQSCLRRSAWAWAHIQTPIRVLTYVNMYSYKMCTYMCINDRLLPYNHRLSKLPASERVGLTKDPRFLRLVQILPARLEAEYETRGANMGPRTAEYFLSRECRVCVCVLSEAVPRGYVCVSVCCV